MKAVAVLTALSLGLTACAADTGEPTSTVEPADSTVAPTTTVPLVVGCPGEGRFVEGGRVDSVENASSDSSAIGLISWQVDEVCETFEISFETAEGAPATTAPSITVDYVEDLAVLRLNTTAQSTVITDQLVETPLVDRLYVVRSLDGGIFLDLHLAQPTQARASIESSPARLVLQLQPGLVEYAGSPAVTGPVVLITPTEDALVDTPLTVEGYARTFESNVLVIATQGDEVISNANTTAADSVDTWGHFRTTIDVMPGPVALFVGDQDAESARFEGVSIGIEAR